MKSGESNRNNKDGPIALHHISQEWQSIIRFITFQYEIWDHSFTYTFFHNFDVQHMKWRNWRSWLLPGRGRAHTQFDKGCSLSLCMVNNLEGRIQDFKWGGGAKFFESPLFVEVAWEGKGRYLTVGQNLSFPPLYPPLLRLKSLG